MSLKKLFIEAINCTDVVLKRKCLELIVRHKFQQAGIKVIAQQMDAPVCLFVYPDQQEAVATAVRSFRLTPTNVDDDLEISHPYVAVAFYQVLPGPWVLNEVVTDMVDEKTFLPIGTRVMGEDDLFCLVRCGYLTDANARLFIEGEDQYPTWFQFVGPYHRPQLDLL